MMKQGITTWRSGKGRIIAFRVFWSRLTSDGVGHLLSLPCNTLSDLSKLVLYNCELDSKSCEVLSNCLSSLPHLEILALTNNRIGCEGPQMLSPSLHSNTSLRRLCVQNANIRDRGGCSLAEALHVNKHLVMINLLGNPLGEKSIKQLIASLQHNHTLQRMELPHNWQYFSQQCDGYNVVKVSFPSHLSIPM